MTWSIGQLIAVATCAPWLIEILFIGYNGLEVAVQYKKPTPDRLGEEHKPDHSREKGG